MEGATFALKIMYLGEMWHFNKGKSGNLENSSEDEILERLLYYVVKTARKFGVHSFMAPYSQELLVHILVDGEIFLNLKQS
ncbi:hypothetical protein NQ315_006820 [Exocentrus adspersus]|uniref:Uncharacterized protein n=1 Tax=Exocentrus adspersus TaxID=1586481 RepID=A0AAV8WBU3_9CUCU|nr:hypothetical protein NQ315_006820 [Exocentrus adspersus]